MTKVKASALRGQSKDELTKQLNEHKQVQYSQTPISDNDWSKAEQIKKIMVGIPIQYLEFPILKRRQSVADCPQTGDFLG